MSVSVANYKAGLNTALYRPKFKLVGFAVNLRTQYSSFV